MKKVALVFVLAVFVPSLVLAWLALRSLRDQQFLIERQQSLLYQGLADRKAKEVQDALMDLQHEFASRVAALIGENDPSETARSFDSLLQKYWTPAQVGFVVTMTGEILSPSALSRPEARAFFAANSRFLANRESAEVYLNPKFVANNTFFANSQQQLAPSQQMEFNNDLLKGGKVPQTRNVVPQQQAAAKNTLIDEAQQLSKVASSEAEFRQLIGQQMEGTVARFVDNKLNLLLWCRPARDPQLVFGAQLSLPRVLEGLKGLVGDLNPTLCEEVCVALLDDNARPLAVSQPGLDAIWKRPFVATEIGEALPHWEIGVYLLNPAKLTAAARTLKLTLGLLIAMLVLAIGVGSWLIVVDLNRHLTLARQKTDFVSNVSHELKTPLTSIRMFSELLAEGRVADAAKQRDYLGIITSEAARLTRLINNVLDFARMERGEKKYHLQPCDVANVARETAEQYRPHLEANGFHFEYVLPESPVMVRGDRDALAQVIVNLLSNAEKYSDGRKEITLTVNTPAAPAARAEVVVLDRGLGVPRGAEERIFEQFYRAHDSLSSGIQGSGLGLTLARQIARAHGGDVAYVAREGGGSCFALSLPRLREVEQS